MSNGHDVVNLWIVSLHDRAPEGYLAFDLWDIVDCLSPASRGYQWVAFDLDVTGEPIEEGKPLTTAELLSRAKKLLQTIDGKFLAYIGRCPDPAEFRTDYARFPESQARAAVVAVDSSYFEVWTKEPEHIRLLKERFSDVRDENPHMYFAGENIDEEL